MVDKFGDVCFTFRSSNCDENFSLVFCQLQSKYESTKKLIMEKAEIMDVIRKETPNNPYYYYQVPRRFKLDMQVTLLSISLLSFRCYCRIMQVVPKSLKQNKEFAREMIERTNGQALHHLGENVRNDKELVLLALKNTGWKHYSAASYELKHDLDIIKQAAIVNRSYTAKFIPEYSKLMETLGFTNRFEFWRHVLGKDYLPAQFSVRLLDGNVMTVIA